MNTDTQKHNEIEDRSIKQAKRLVYFYILLGFIDGLLLLDFSIDQVHFMICVVTIYIGFSVLIGWLMLNAISKKSKISYVIPFVVFIVYASFIGYDFYNLPVSVDSIIPILELITLAILFFAMRDCYVTLGWEKSNSN